jgi:hypothetical protein
MDYLDPQKKKRKRTKLMVGYGLLGTAIALATLILVYVTTGYYVDRNTGEVIQNGLIYVDSKPESASVLLNGVDQGTRTDARLVVPDGRYTVQLARDGYQPWARTIDLEGGSVRRLNYARLIPTNLETAPVLTIEDQPSVVSQSIDKRWLVLAYNNNALEMKTIDIESATFTIQDIKFPVDLVESDALEGTWEIVEWADDNKVFLASYTTEDGVEYLLINRDKPLESVNLSTRLEDVPFTELTLRNRKNDLLFVYDEDKKSLSKIKTDGTERELYIENVEEYSTFGENVLYIRNMTDDKTKSVAILKEGTTEYPLRELKRTKEYLLDISKIGSAFVAGVTSAEEDRAFIYYDPIKSFNQDNPPKYPVLATVLRVADPEELRISQNSSAITVRSGQRFATHEFEEERTFAFSVGGTVNTNQEFRWLDGRHFTISIDGVQYMIDYSGDNQYRLVESVKGFGSYFDKDIDFLFTFSPQDKQEDTPARMLRTFMRTAEDR